MTTFEERERGFEAKFAHDEDLRFRQVARRDKLFARWAAGRLNLVDAGAAEMEAAVLAVADGAGHDGRVLQLVSARFLDRGELLPDQVFADALAACSAAAEA